MSVYKRHPTDETYTFDLTSGGKRLAGDTGKTTRREAERVLVAERAKAKAALKVALAQTKKPMVFGEATKLYFSEVGAHQTNAETVISNIEWLERNIGTSTPMTSIDDRLVATLVAKRRSEFRQVGRIENRTKLVGPATVNRTMTEPLRKIMLRAADVWGAPTGKVRWGTHMLAEPQERVREATLEQEAAIMDSLTEGYADAVRFSFLNGCRRMEVVGLRWTDVDFFGRQFTVTGKARRSRSIPMSDETYKLLWGLKDHHPDVVFTYVAQRRDPRKGLVAGLRYPMTDAGLRTAMRRAVVLAGVDGFRYHDTRHTAATRTLRKSNMRVVQTLLGHKDIATTAKYAHATADDVRLALDAVTRSEKHTKEAGE